MIHTQQDLLKLVFVFNKAWSVISSFFLVITLFVSGGSLAATVDGAAICQAPDDYRIGIDPAGSNNVTAIDFSCLTDLPSISPDLSAYQLVDVRQRGELLADSFSAWRIPLVELKTKSFLKKRQLLLIDEGFSRVRAASDCMTLKKEGFDHVKILVGGVDVWHAYKHNPKSRNQSSSQSNRIVSAQEVLYEYANKKVLLIAGSHEASNALKLLGLEHHLFIENITDEKIAQIVISESEGGLVPAVVLDEAHISDLSLSNRLPNLYVLPGGIIALSEQIQKNIQTNRGRTTASERFFCANS